MSNYKFAIEKQPSEKLTIGVDFAADLDSSEIISTATVTASLVSDGTDDSADLLSGNPQIQNGEQTSSKIVQKIKDGTDGEQYKITFKATTDDPHIFEADVIVTVRER